MERRHDLYIIPIESVQEITANSLRCLPRCVGCSIDIGTVQRADSGLNEFAPLDLNRAGQYGMRPDYRKDSAQSWQALARPRPRVDFNERMHLGDSRTSRVRLRRLPWRPLNRVP